MAVNGENQVRIGIDIGGMSVKIGLVEQQRIISRKVIDTDSARQSPYGLIDRIADSVEALLHENGIISKSCKHTRWGHFGTKGISDGTASEDSEWNVFWRSPWGDTADCHFGAWK